LPVLELRRGARRRADDMTDDDFAFIVNGRLWVGKQQVLQSVPFKPERIFVSHPERTYDEMVDWILNDPNFIRDGHDPGDEDRGPREWRIT
jgi:hypothetical protein